MSIRLALVLSLVVLALCPATSLAQDVSAERAASLEAPHLQLTEPELTVRHEVHDDQVVGRVFAELGMGVTAAMIGGMVGGFAGAAIGAAAGGEQFFSFSGLEGGLIGHGVAAVLLMPLAVSWAASWCDGRGDVWAAYLGELAGIALSAGLIGIGEATNDYTVSTVGFVSLLVLPLVGAVAGYELSDDANRAASTTDEDATQISVMPTVAPTADGQGVMLGAAGSF